MNFAKRVSSLFILLASFSVPVMAAENPQAAKTQNSVEAAKAAEKLLMDIKQVANNRLVAVGERGHILISDDEGDTWRQVIVPTQTLLTRLFFVNENVGWAVGHEQMIIKTEDAGETWKVQYQNDSLDQPALFDVWFKNPNNGIAIGAYGLYLKTEDGGANWEEVYHDTLEDMEIGMPHFYSIDYEAKSGKLFMAAEFGTLAYSDDLGETWNRFESPYTGSFFNIQALPNGHVIAMGLRGHLFRTTDLGTSWQEVETGTISGLQRSVLLPNHKLLIVGSDGTQLLSDNFAKSVKLIQRPDRVHLASAIGLTGSKILVVGTNGVTQAELN